MEQDANRPKIEDIEAMVAKAGTLCEEMRSALGEYDFKTARVRLAELTTRLAPLEDLMALVERDLRVEAFDAFNRIRTTEDGDEKMEIFEDFLRKLGGP